MENEYLYFEKNGDLYRLSAIQDEFPENPRELDEGLMGTMVCFHRRYELGDKHNFKSPRELDDFLKQEEVVSLPIYMLDHSGLRFSVNTFNDPWDSGQVGYIYTTKDRYKELMGTVPEDWKEKAKGYMKAEVEEYDCYHAGFCYGCTVEKLDSDDRATLLNHFPVSELNWEDDGTVWGFYSYAYGYELLKELANEIVSAGTKLYKDVELTEVA